MYKLSFLTLALALAACGGGGGGSAAGTTIPTTPKATFAGGFVQQSGAAQSSNRRILGLSGTIIPFALFDVEDAYITHHLQGGDYSYEAVGYFTGAPPSPLPTATYAQSGNPLPFAGTVAAQPSPDSFGRTFLNGQMINRPTTVGPTTITVSVPGSSVTMTAAAYRGLGLSAAGSNTYGNPSSLTFTAGIASPTVAGPGDISIDASVTPTKFTAPGGIVQVAKGFASVTPADFTGSATTLQTTALCDGQVHTILFKLGDGTIVRFQPMTIAGTNVGPSVCAITDTYGFYQASVSGSFPY